ncbi:hypothetical protein M2103_001989 [Ereboglobus sp. PH5-5]|uniref:DUF4340 domain-containing protein n=1 Tax=unclassified Ereboglobus TaxID=2626932 RepID=UPI0024073FBF|nr:MULTISPECIES: DUF4340 domain-containing protein [unclassified Ereboglobus]MDF9827279.1 hypothetical protein [Ereboglobus sp. PH5-10]MDF9833756.1 hypothetical protein [Ereboglobus sp. PH5-5]
MRTKITIVLLLLNAALFYYIFYVRQHDIGDRETTTILGSEASNIQAITIEDPDQPGSAIHLVRQGDNWTISSPVEWPANPFAVRPIIADLQRLYSITSFTVQDLVKSGQTLDEYGLEKPKRILTFTPASLPGLPVNPVTLKIGAPTQAGNRLYILSPDGQRVHIVMRSLAESLNVRLDTLRADTLFTIDVFEARSLNIEPAAGSRVRFRRDNERWALEAPIQARASKTGTEITINDLRGLRVDRFLDTADTAAPARDSLALPALRVTVEGNNRSETLLIGDRLEKAPSAASGGEDTEPAAEYYAQLDGRKAYFIVRIPDILVKTLRDAQQDLRDRHILDFNRANVTSITIAAAQQTEVVLQRLEATGNPESAPWQIIRRTDHGPQITPADHDAVVRLLDSLAGLRVLQDGTEGKGFVNDAPSDAEKENYGFTMRPAREITLNFAAAPALTLQVGSGASTVAETAGNTYARVTNQNYIYRVSPDILDELPANPLAYRDRVIRELPAGAQITALKLTDLARRVVVMDAAFPLEPGTVGREAIESLSAQLRTLRAKRFTSDDFANTIYVAGEERSWAYQLEMTITLSGGAAARTDTDSLFVAARSGGTTQYIGSPQYRVIFEAEQSLIDALHTITYGPRDPGPPEPSK